MVWYDMAVAWMLERVLNKIGHKLSGVLECSCWNWQLGGPNPVLVGDVGRQAIGALGYCLPMVFRRHRAMSNQYRPTVFASVSREEKLVVSLLFFRVSFCCRLYSGSRRKYLYS